MEKVQLSDRELVENLQAGNDEAYIIITKRYSKKIINIIFSIIKDKEQAYDLLQETMIKIYKNINQFKGNSSFFTWMTRIAINVSFNYLRSQKNVLLFSKKDSEDDESIDMFDNISYSDSREENPEEIVLDRIEKQKLHNIIDSLDPIHRLTLRLKYFDNFSTKEIAEATEVPEGTVRSRLHYARTYLKDKLN